MADTEPVLAERRLSSFSGVTMVSYMLQVVLILLGAFAIIATVGRQTGRGLESAVVALAGPWALVLPQYDLDDSGTLNLAEFTAFVNDGEGGEDDIPGAFDQADADDSGDLDEAEFNSYVSGGPS